ncbi:MAG TPA: hypothetical protein VMF12_00425 [Xanthobacteraceae bacterium]|nr:hypothetical protein [Xanthobacteraceae bacterium]
MIRKAFAAIIAGLVLTASAVAEDSPTPPNDEGRYTFHKVTDGFLRLDKETGEVALCSQQAVGWACLAAPEDRAVLENEIARLRKDNAALKADLLSHGLALPPGIMEEPPAAGGGRSVTFRLPDSADFDRVMLFVGRLWHHLVDAIANAQNQVLHRG